MPMMYALQCAAGGGRGGYAWDPEYHADFFILHAPLSLGTCIHPRMHQ